MGIGGSGKTTLARFYASRQNASIIWEINAQTRDTLRDAFENLAFALATTLEERKILREIQNITESHIKEKQLLSFVQGRLRANPCWVLIYDNLEIATFSEIKDWIPREVTVWGTGRAIITTRDTNIRNTKYVEPNNVVYVETLEKHEKKRSL